MKKETVIELYLALTQLGVPIWIDGGWGVDALLGRQTRFHDDLDVVVQKKHVARLREFLKARGYSEILQDDTSDWNFVLADPNNNKVDVHVIVFDEKRNGIYGPPEDGVFYPADSLLGKGIIDNVVVQCLTPEYQVESHIGYLLGEKDYQDVRALCNKFEIALPFEFHHNDNNKLLVNLYHQAEDYFFRAISTESLSLSDGVNVYVTEVPVADLNLAYISKPQNKLEDVLLHIKNFFDRHNFSFVVILSEEFCTTNIKNDFYEMNYRQTGESISMAIDLEKDIAYSFASVAEVDIHQHGHIDLCIGSRASADKKCKSSSF